MSTLIKWQTLEIKLIKMIVNLLTYLEEKRLEDLSYKSTQQENIKLEDKVDKNNIKTDHLKLD